MLKPLHEEAGLVRVRVATYQSVSGAGAQAMERLATRRPDEHDLRMDWDFDGVTYGTFAPDANGYQFPSLAQHHRRLPPDGVARHQHGTHLHRSRAASCSTPPRAKGCA